MKSVTLPNSLKEIGQSDFEDCKILTGIKLPASLEVLGEKAFRNCALITEVNIPAAIVRVESETFNGCAKLAKVVFDGNSVKNIENRAFEKCTGIVSVNFVASGLLESIGEEAFSGSPIGGILDIPETVRNIDGRAFFETGKNEITDVYLYEFIDYIGDDAFNIAYKNNLRFHVVADTPAEIWLKEHGFEECIAESSPKGELFIITFDLMEHGSNFERRVKEGTGDQRWSVCT